MPWQKLEKDRWGAREYTAPVVRLTWYRPKKAQCPVASFTFTQEAKRTLKYKGEKFCDVYKDGARLLFKFRKKRVKSSRKVNQPKGSNISVRLYKKPLDPVTPGDSLFFLLRAEEPKVGIINLSEPVKSPEKYMAV